MPLHPRRPKPARNGYLLLHNLSRISISLHRHPHCCLRPNFLFRRCDPPACEQRCDEFLGSVSQPDRGESVLHGVRLPGSRRDHRFRDGGDEGNESECYDVDGDEVDEWEWDEWQWWEYADWERGDEFGERCELKFGSESDEFRWIRRCGCGGWRACCGGSVGSKRPRDGRQCILRSEVRSREFKSRYDVEKILNRAFEAVGQVKVFQIIKFKDF